MSKVTSEVVQQALAFAQENGIKKIVVASNTGDTALLTANEFAEIICVTHSFGHAGNGKQELTSEARAALLAKNIKILTTGHALSGAERGLSSKFSGIYPLELIAHSLRMFGQGTKVAVEISLMAMDAGLVNYGEKIVAIAGTGRGADTALLLTPGYSAKIFDTKIHKTICKPELVFIETK